MPDFKNDEAPILRLFGSADPVRAARLQFADCFVNNKERMKSVGLTEVKFENAINRISSVANPRQIERVVPGTSFGVNIVYEFSGYCNWTISADMVHAAAAESASRTSA